MKKNKIFNNGDKGKPRPPYIVDKFLSDGEQKYSLPSACCPTTDSYALCSVLDRYSITSSENSTFIVVI